MFPFIPAESRLRLITCGPSQLRPGIIVCFIDGEGQLVAHRVIGAHPAGRVVVRGDRNDAWELVPTTALLGQVAEVHHGRWKYNTHGFIGHLMANVALKHRRLHGLLAKAAWLWVRHAR